MEFLLSCDTAPSFRPAPPLLALPFAAGAQRHACPAGDFSCNLRHTRPKDLLSDPHDSDPAPIAPIAIGQPDPSLSMQMTGLTGAQIGAGRDVAGLRPFLIHQRRENMTNTQLLMDMLSPLPPVEAEPPKARTRIDVMMPPLKRREQHPATL